MNAKAFYGLQRTVEAMEVRLAILEARLAEDDDKPLDMGAVMKRGPGRPRKEA